MAAKKTELVKGKIKPTAGHVAIKPLEPEKKTSSGIYLPESSGSKTTMGRVIAVGPDEITDAGTKKKSPVKKDDVVFYNRIGSNEVIIETEEFLFVKFDDILAVIKE